MSCDGSRRVTRVLVVDDKYGRHAFCFAGPFVWNSLTCRILAGWPLRNSATTSRSSRPVFFACSRSSLVLKPLTVFAIKESLSSIFYLDTTQWEKKYFLISLLHRHLTSFNECPRVLPVASIWNISVNGIAEKTWAILKTSIKSARFRRFSKVHSPSFCNLASYCNDLRLVIIRVNLCCTFSRSFLSFW